MFMYSWGTVGQLGRPVGDGLGNNPPRHNQIGRVGDAYWISSATSASGSLAVRADGQLFRLVGTAPERIGLASNWVQVSARSGNRVALNTQGQIFHFNEGGTPVTPIAGSQIQGRTWEYIMSGNSAAFAINDLGHLYSVLTGANTEGNRDLLGRGSGATVNPALGRITVPPNNPLCDLEWVSIRAGASVILAVTDCGKLFSWGSSAGILGRSTNTALLNGIGQPNVPHYEPGRVGMTASCSGFNENWVTVGTTNGSSAAINSLGHLYTWGTAAELGRGTPPAASSPGRVNLQGQDGNPARFRSIHGGNGHFLAFTDEFRLYGWGTNSAGQLGLGHNNPVSAVSGPQFVVQTYGFSNAARGGGSVSIMLMRTTPAEGDLYIEKNVRKLQAAPGPTLEFEFEFERHSFNGNITQANLLPSIPNLTVEIDNTSDSTTAGGITTLTSRENALAGITFTQVGIYSWMITEVEDSSGTNTIPPGVRRVNYSQAVYEVRIDVRQRLADFYIYDVTLLRHRTAGGTAVVPPEPVTGFDNTVFFTNDYRRFSLGTNTCAGALTVSKEIDGDFVDPATPFTFEVTLTGTALCVAGTEFSARVYGPNNNFIRTESFEVGETETVILLDEQTLVFPYLPVGLQWEVEELELLEFTAALELTVNGVTNPRVTNPNPQLDLSTGVHTITAENLRNSAHFINIHFITPPMGLVLGDGAAPVIIVGAGIMFAALLATKSRKRIEEIESIEPLEQVDPLEPVANRHQDTDNEP